MELVGLSISQFLSLITAGIITITIFYILKLRLRKVEVPFIPLWTELLKEKETTSLWSKLKSFLSLLLQLLILMLILTALADPRPKEWLRNGRNYIILLDDSASMNTKEDINKTRFDIAKEKIKQIISQLAVQDKMMIVEFDSIATPVTPLTNDKTVLIQVLDELRPADTEGNIAPALELTLAVTSGLRNYNVILVSDGSYRQIPSFEENSKRINSLLSKTSLIKIGTSKNNIAITGFSARRHYLDPNLISIFLELFNSSSQEQSVEITHYSDGLPQPQGVLKLEPNSKKSLFADSSSVREKLEVVVRPIGEKQCKTNNECSKNERCVLIEDTNSGKCTYTENFIIDNHDYGTLATRMPVKILVVSRNNLYLKAVLLLDDLWMVDEVEPEMFKANFDYTANKTEETNPYDVIIFDNCAPILPQIGNFIYLNPVGDNPPFAIEGFSDINPPWKRIDNNNPVLRFVNLRYVNFDKLLKVKLDKGDKVLAYSDKNIPGVVIREKNNQKIISLNFDPRRSDIVMRISWPLFIINSIRWLKGEDVRYISSYTTGQVWEIPSAGSKVTLTDPVRNKQQYIPNQGLISFFPQMAGFYNLRSKEYNHNIAVNLSSYIEANLEVPQKIKIGNRTLPEFEEITYKFNYIPWPYILMLSIIMILIEWLTYHRRMTV